jgi:hypothetical protein
MRSGDHRVQGETLQKECELSWRRGAVEQGDEADEAR